MGSGPTSSDDPGRSGGGDGPVCLVYETPVIEFDAPQFLPVTDLEEGRTYWIHCRRGGVTVGQPRYFVHEPGTPPISNEGLARRAAETLVLDLPSATTNPDPDARQLPGVETWLWVDPASWEPQRETASIPGLSATVTATPERVTWDMGDGTTVVCEGPGTPYDTSLPPEDQATDCGHVYQRAGTPTVTVTVSWRIDWTATDGDAGSLGTVDRTSTLQLTVVDRQAVGTR